MREGGPGAGAGEPTLLPRPLLQLLAPLLLLQLARPGPKAGPPCDGRPCFLSEHSDETIPTFALVRGVDRTVPAMPLGPYYPAER